MNTVALYEGASDKLSNIHKKCFVSSWSIDEIDQLRQLKTTFIIGIENNNEYLCGFVMLQCCNDAAEILTICVDPIEQGNNYGKCLLLSAHSLLKTMEVVDVFLEVSENNAAALHLYKSLDFSIVGKRKAYYSDGASALLMKKIL